MIGIVTRPGESRLRWTLEIGAPRRPIGLVLSTRAGERVAMTYCLGITTRDGLVLASDSRSNAGADQVNVCRKMHTLVRPGERLFGLLTSGSLSCSQSVITLLGRDFAHGLGLAAAETFYPA